MATLRDEIIGIRESAEKQADKDIKPILQAYKRVLEETRQEIAQLYVKYAVEGKLQISKQQRYTFLKNLEKQLKDQMRVLGGIDLDHTTKILGEIYQDSYYKTAYAIEKGISAAVNFALLNPKMVEAAVNTPIDGELFSSRIWRNKEQLVKVLRREIENGIIKGHSIDKMSKVIKDRFGVAAWQSQRLIRTELGRAVGTAQKDIYESSEAVKKVMWDATLDNETRPEHAKLDGQTWDIDDPKRKYAPDGVNCRCATIPVVDGWKPRTKRDNVTKKVIPYQTYEEWSKEKGIKK